ncbi:MAG: efflux RND transporter permease subunit [Candidatus Gracilibacteria bacterium]|nr:efflux RND transporter permease subunit [Candidatus Gracilibacteria bacterium]
MQTERADVKKLLEKEYGLEKVKNSIPGFFLRNAKFSWIVYTGVVLLGISSLTVIPIELQPEISFPSAIVNVIYPGAAPEYVEELVTTKIEDAVENLDEVDEYTSTAGNGFSSTFIQFEESADATEKVNELKTEIDKIKGDLPDGAEDPNVTEFDVTGEPILIVNVLGENYSQKELRDIADILKDKISAVAGISKVTVSGGHERAFNIVVDLRKLEHFGLNMSDLASALSLNNMNLPIGNLDIGEFYYAVTQEGEYENMADILTSPITLRSGQIIQVRDVAKVEDSVEETYGASYFGRPQAGILESVSLSIYKKSGGNIIEAANGAKDLIEEASQNGTIPADIETTVSLDYSKFISDDISNLSQSGLMTLVVVFLVLLFVGYKEAIISAISVPISFLATFAVLNVMGYTLNNITLFSLILALGLLVDTSIVVVEGCHHYVTKGYSGYKAALLALRDYKASVISGTLTTVAAFAPMMFMKGIVGQFIRVVPLTVSLVLISALFIALTFNTLLASKILKPSPEKKRKERSKCGMYCLYKKFLEQALLKKSLRWSFLAGIIGLFIISLFVIAPRMQVEFFPQSDLDFFSISIEAPQDVSLEITLEAAQKVEEILLEIPDIESFTMNVGAASFGSTHTASSFVTLKEERELTQNEIAEIVKGKVQEITGVKVVVEQANMGPPVARPINIRLLGNDFLQLEQVSRQIVEEIKDIPGVSDPDTDVRYGAGEFTIRVDKEKAIKKGLAAIQVAQNLRYALHGSEATTIRREGEEISLILKAQDDQVETVSDIKKIAIINPMGEKVRVRDIAEVQFDASVSELNHRDGRKIVETYSYVTGQNEQGKDFTAAEVLSAIQEQLETICLPSELQDRNIQNWQQQADNYKRENKLGQYCVNEEITVEFGGEEEMSAESFDSLGQAVIIGIILIIAILVFQFNSYIQPAIVMTAIPLGLIGVFPGLWLLGINLSFPSFIGIASLSGIAVNDAIILVSKMNQNRQEGKPLMESIVNAGIARWKPILITTTTTAIGLFPLVFVDIFYAAISWAIIFGIYTATLLSMFVIPMLYYMTLPRKIKKTLVISV